MGARGPFWGVLACCIVWLIAVQTSHAAPTAATQDDIYAAVSALTESIYWLGLFFAGAFMFGLGFIGGRLR